MQRIREIERCVTTERTDGRKETSKNIKTEEERKKKM